MSPDYVSSKSGLRLNWRQTRTSTFDYYNISIDYLLELIEECVQAKYDDDQILLSSLSKKIEDLAERNLFERNQEMENEIILDR